MFRTIASVSSARGRLDIVKHRRRKNRTEKMRGEGGMLEAKKKQVESEKKKKLKKKKTQQFSPSLSFPTLSLFSRSRRSPPSPSSYQDAASRLRLGHGHAARRNRRRARRGKQARGFDVHEVVVNVVVVDRPSPIKAGFLGAATLCCSPDRLQRCVWRTRISTRIHDILMFRKKNAKEERNKEDLIGHSIV